MSHQEKFLKIIEILLESSNCNYDLRSSNVEFIKANSKALEVQIKLLNILYCEYYKLNGRYFYSIGLFYLLRILIKNIMKVQNTDKIYLETLSPRELAFYLTYSLLLLKNFPYRINRFYKKEKFTNLHKILDKYRNKRINIPNWYLKGIIYNNIEARWKICNHNKNPQ